ncbi:MAG: phenylalanine--tRNA ligase subunit beta [Limnobacter sp.]|nr:phenylalanine--tRNA ligase subunit beta [Limnobacter sp.]
MQFNESWLKSLVDTPLSTAELSDKLTMAGLEVEELNPVAPAFNGVVVGHIVSREKHPDADRLSVCMVDVGDGSPRQIVCGAPNAAAGIKIPCALPGAVLPGEFHIKPTKMRGVESGGMLCSSKELGIAGDASGLHVLPEDAPVGADIREYLNLNEMVFTLKMTPNRADCLSVWGVAREVSALTGAKLNAPSFAPVPASIQDTLAVKIEDSNLCGRFAGRVIRGVSNSVKAPAWMIDRLEKAGQRSLSPLVDISNYVMLELGRPSHVFDLNKLQGGLTVRWANAGEKLKLLNEQEITLTPRVGVICDQAGPQAMAGVMGGDHTAVSEVTTDIFVEAAFWPPSAIAGRAREYNFGSDAAHRFERGVDFSSIPEHMELITRLILDICGGQAGPVVDQVLGLPSRKPVTLRHARAESVIGMELSNPQVQEVFDRLGFTTQAQGVGKSMTYTVTPPSYRFDIEIEEDLIEEVIRVVGYESLPLRAPMGRISMLPNTELKLSRNNLRHKVAALGYQEVVSYAFTPEKWEKDLTDNADPVRLLNPIASHLSVMRSSLVGSLVSVLKHNLGHRVDRLRVFEVARTFVKDASVQDSAMTVKGFRQTWKLAGLAFGLADQLQWAASGNRTLDFFDVKGDVEQLLSQGELEFKPANHVALHPGRSAEVFLNGKAIGVMGELHPQWVQEYDLPAAPIVFELLAEDMLLQALPAFSEVSKQPVVIRDLAFVVSQTVQADAVKKALLATPDDNLVWLKSVILFDEFVPKEEGKGLNANEKSLAFRLTLQSPDRSLNDADTEPLLQKMIEQVSSTTGARLR